jgi:predicted permease
VVCIAAANLMALSYARITAREQELRIRAALGAGRGRVFRVIVAEFIVLCALGTLLASFTAHLVLRAIGMVNPDAVPRFASASVDGTGLLFAAAAALLVCTALAFVSALVIRLDSSGLGVRGGSRRSSGILRSGLIMGQVAICLVLLVGTGLLVQTVHAYRTADRGVDTSGRTVTFFPSMGSFRYAGQHDQILSFHAALTDRLRATQLVSDVGTTSQLPMTGAGAERFIAWDAATESAWGSARAGVQVVSDGYLEAVGTTMLRGRSFQGSDRRGQASVAIVDERLAGRAWPGQDPVGRTVLLQMNANGIDSAGPQRVRVVGVARSVRDDLTTSQAGAGRIYLPFAQQPALTFFHVVRTTGPEASILQAAQAVIRETDPDIALTRVGSLAGLLDDATRKERLALLLLSTFAGVAVLLALVGVHGVVSFTVQRRMTEYGVRLALGAMPRRIAARILGQTIGPALAGVGAGVGFALLSSRLLESVVFGVRLSDPWTYVGASAALILAILVATAVPAARVMVLEPAKVLAPE